MYIRQANKKDQITVKLEVNCWTGKR